MSLQLWPAPHVFLAKVDDDIILLNVREDRYDALLGVGRDIVLDDDGSIHAASAAIASELERAGIAVPAPPAVPCPRAEPPRGEVAVCPRPPLVDVLRAAVVLTTATLRFRRRSFHSLIRFRHRVLSPSDGGEARLERLVGAARSARPWIPFEGECLQRAFLLRAWLAAQGVATDWVFGVATWPFSAHCWLQIGDVVVGDRLSRVARFTPILRV